jgi:hypothetical protein
VAAADRHATDEHGGGRSTFGGLHLDMMVSVSPPARHVHPWAAPRWNMRP